MSPFVAEPPPGWRDGDGRRVAEDDRITAAAAMPDVTPDGTPPGERDDPLPDRREPPPRPDLGPLSGVAEAEGVTDVFVTGDGAVWVDRGLGVERRSGWIPPPVARELAARLISQGGRHIDEATPCCDVRLGDGMRVHAVLPPISTGGALISLRLPRAVPLDAEALDALGAFGRFGLEPLRRAIVQRRNLLITGAGGSGKTTLLGALLGLAPPAERLVVLEDVAELRIAHPHVVTLQARQPNLDGAGGLGLDRLLREALRMRPDRLVVGECRGAETRELLAALNTGHDGGAGTLHANSLADVPARLEALGAIAGMDAAQVARQAVSALHLLVHVARTAEGRRVVALGRLALDPGGRLGVEELGAGTS